MFAKRDYCRYCGLECHNFKLDKESPNKSFCKKTDNTISKTTPKGGNVKAPAWCPKRHPKKKH